jgi:lipoprotein-releasing system permease protein
MNIEKWVSYLITSLTLLLIAFNLVGALWMIVLDKKKDISILRSMGMNRADIEKLFRRVGILITLIGLASGIFMALILYILQKKVGLIHIPDSFMLTSYPISINYIDFIVVSITVITIGYVASLLPAKVAGKIETTLR